MTQHPPTHPLPTVYLGNYGNQIDGVSKPSLKKKKREGGGENDEEESELIQNSSEEDEGDEEGDLVSVSSTPPMKPVITDRSEFKGHPVNLINCTHTHTHTLSLKEVVWSMIPTGNNKNIMPTVTVLDIMSVCS